MMKSFTFALLTLFILSGNALGSEKNLEDYIQWLRLQFALGDESQQQYYCSICWKIERPCWLISALR
ncbi:MAG: hypothetical protein OQK97_10645, partial [Deltaproteobacteria bacterium]|nr:hypothetical protein [Deltaproteobacteria bacterium]